ncbi:hypothetical protein GBA52_010337 [Prunus armeniaca]|nr:hypothetical protein GBA52_010337 [Prunus armeniaca]
MFPTLEVELGVNAKERCNHGHWIIAKILTDGPNCAKKCSEQHVGYGQRLVVHCERVHINSFSSNIRLESNRVSKTRLENTRILNRVGSASWVH